MKNIKFKPFTFSSSLWTNFSVGLSTLPKGRGNSMFPHLNNEFNFRKILLEEVNIRKHLAQGYLKPTNNILFEVLEGSSVIQFSSHIQWVWFTVYQSKRVHLYKTEIQICKRWWELKIYQIINKFSMKQYNLYIRIAKSTKGSQ